MHEAEGPVHPASFTRKLCQYPAVARCKGTGDPDSAANFVRVSGQLQMGSHNTSGADHRPMLAFGSDLLRAGNGVKGLVRNRDSNGLEERKRLTC
jgi:hypothetical protein